MNRRTLIKRLATVSTAGVAGLAGCSSGGGGSDPTGEVVTNEFDSIMIQSHRVENTTVLGSEAVQTVVTLENTSSESVEVRMNTTLYDSDDTVIGSDDLTVDETIEADTTEEVSEAYEGRKGDVARYEIELLEEKSFLQ